MATKRRAAKPRRPPKTSTLNPVDAERFVEGDFQNSRSDEEVQMSGHSEPQSFRSQKLPKSSDLEIQTSRTSEIPNPETSNPKTSEVSDAQTSETPKVVKMGRPRRTTKRRQCTIYLTPAMKKRLQRFALDAEMEMSDVVAEALEAFLQDKGA